MDLGEGDRESVSLKALCRRPEADDAEKRQGQWGLAFAAGHYDICDFEVGGVSSALLGNDLGVCGVDFGDLCAGLLTKALVEEEALGAVGALGEEMAESRRAAPELDVDELSLLSEYVADLHLVGSTVIDEFLIQA